MLKSLIVTLVAVSSVCAADLKWVGSSSALTTDAVWSGANPNTDIPTSTKIGSNGKDTLTRIEKGNTLTVGGSLKLAGKVSIKLGGDASSKSSIKVGGTANKQATATFTLSFSGAEDAATLYDYGCNLNWADSTGAISSSAPCGDDVVTFPADNTYYSFVNTTAGTVGASSVKSGSTVYMDSCAATPTTGGLLQLNLMGSCGATFKFDSTAVCVATTCPGFVLTSSDGSQITFYTGARKSTVAVVNADGTISLANATVNEDGSVSYKGATMYSDGTGASSSSDSSMGNVAVIGGAVGGGVVLLLLILVVVVVVKKKKTKDGSSKGRGGNVESFDNPMYDQGIVKENPGFVEEEGGFGTSGYLDVEPQV